MYVPLSLIQKISFLIYQAESIYFLLKKRKQQKEKRRKKKNSLHFKPDLLNL